MSEDSILQIALAVISVFGVVMTAVIGRLTFQVGKVRKDATATAVDAAEARRLATRTDHSINNRDSPLSDRVDDLHKDVRAAVRTMTAVAEKLTTQGVELSAQGVELREQRKDILGIRKDHLETRKEVGILHGEDREIRDVLTDHIRTTEPMLPMLKELHKQYTPRPRRR